MNKPDAKQRFARLLLASCEAPADEPMPPVPAALREKIATFEAKHHASLLHGNQGHQA